MPPDDCLAEDVVARLVEGKLVGGELERAERHLAECAACTSVVADVGRAIASDSGDEPAGAPVPALVRGARVGRYVVLEAVGAGGMGRVYAAQDPALGRKVALKLLHRRAAAPELEARLLREAQAMARLEHPEVITVHDVGRFGDQLFLAMEFVDGGTLRHWLAGGPRTWREILGVFLRAGRGLAQAHASGIVHRDFKPDNVLVGEDGRVRVTDFGLARAEQAEDAPVSASETFDIESSATLTRTGVAVGTPAYMAPEMIDGKAADVRSDVYAFSVALWEALYGQRPFRGATLGEIRAAMRSDEPTPRTSERGVPGRVREALVAGLRAEPARRVASMEVLLASLEEAARPRSPWGAMGVGVVAVGVAAALVAGVAGARKKAAAPVQTAVPGCATAGECVDAHGGAAWTCRAADHACVALASEDCTPLYEPGDLKAEDTVWLGAMFPTKVANPNSPSKMNLDGVELARKEIAAATASLTRPGASLRVPRIALIACDDSVDAMRSAKHLVEDVETPAILGFGSGREVVDVAGSYLIGRHVLTMATLTMSPAITRLPQAADMPRMVWRTTSNIETLGEATAHFIDDTLQPAIAQRAAHVALLREDEWAQQMTYGEALYRELARKGPPMASRYVELTVPAGDAVRATAKELGARVVAARAAFVVMLADASWMIAVAQALEEQWPPDEPRPTYLIALDSTSALQAFFDGHPERRRRVFAMSEVVMPTVTARFLLRFNALHPGEATESLNPGTTYDAVYALAYAAFSTPGEVTGPSLGLGLAKLAGGQQPIEVGPTDVLKAIAALSRGESIDLTGSSGALDFDPSTGEVMTDFALLCAGSPGSDDVESGLVYVASRRTMKGKVRCP